LNEYEQNNIPDGFNTNVKKIVMNNLRTCIILNNGNVSCFGSKIDGKNSIPIGFNTNVKNIYMAGSNKCILRNDSFANCFGDNF